MNETYVSRETFEQFLKRFDDHQIHQDKILETLAANDKMIISRLWHMGVVLVMALSSLSGWLMVHGAPWQG